MHKKKCRKGKSKGRRKINKIAANGNCIANDCIDPFSTHVRVNSPWRQFLLPFTQLPTTTCWVFYCRSSPEGKTKENRIAHVGQSAKCAGEMKAKKN